MIYDISQPLPDCMIYPGNPVPELRALQRTANGDICNLSQLSMCVHNGTHVDAPFHFFGDGKGIDEIPMEKFIGPAFVHEHNGPLSAEDADRILRLAKAARPGAEKRILLKGKPVVTRESAAVFADAGVDLIGNDSQTIGPENAPMAVHLVLLAAGAVLLEGTRLDSVPEGAYLLNCAPLKLRGCDGAPCRAVLMTL